jgi:dihydroorotate dehydrogenase
VALPALARFGIGFLEIGPVTLAGSAGAAPLSRRADQQAIWRPEPSAALPLAEALDRLQEVRQEKVPLVVHVAAAAMATAEQAGVEYDHLVRKLALVADVLVLDSLAGAVAGEWKGETWKEHLRRVLASVHETRAGLPVLLAVPADLPVSAIECYLDDAVTAGIAGFALDGSMRAGVEGRVYGLPVLALALDQVRRLHARWPALPILGGGGIHEPEHALEMIRVGATLVSIDTGLIYTGPGLPKRISEALLYADPPAEVASAELAPTERVWFWTTLLAVGMLLGSVMALVIASTQIVLPYDLHFVGMSRAELVEINPRLLLFLAHDRVSLAGAMIAIGVMYLALSLWGIRAGLHWAQQSVFISSFTGFATFFLFLGYGYLDPFHAFVTAIMFQFLLLALHSKLGAPPIPQLPQLYSDWRWRMAQWGQLVLIGHAGAMMVAGVVIACFGITRVFVPEDLAFMNTTAEYLQSHNDKLLPLIAHDRATFGGQLIAAGLVLLLPALWGFRPASAWLWWSMLLAILPGYGAAIAVHHVVGYDDLWHLTPAYGGLLLALVGLALSYPFLSAPGSTAEEWQRFRRAT